MNSSSKSYNENELAAAEWLSRRDGGMTTAEETELAQWLASDPKHAKTFHELAHTWGQLDLVRRGSRADSEPAPERRPARVLRFPRTVSVAIAASIVIAVGVWHFQRDVETPFATAAITEARSPRSVHLPDGSVVQLNANSAVEVKYDSTGRHVRMVRGEAHFTVAPDKSKPFIVSVGQIAVRAVGTAFNVRFTSASVEVLVTEGKVTVDDSGKRQSLLLETTRQDRQNPVLSAGERVVVPLTSMQPVPATVALLPATEIQQILAWKEQRLEFDTVPLKTIVAEFNRHNRHQLVIADPRLEGLRFGGTFPADDYESLVRLLVHNYGVVAKTQGDQTIMRLAPSK